MPPLGGGGATLGVSVGLKFCISQCWHYVTSPVRLRMPLPILVAITDGINLLNICCIFTVQHSDLEEEPGKPLKGSLCTLKWYNCERIPGSSSRSHIAFQVIIAVPKDLTDKDKEGIIKLRSPRDAQKLWGMLRPLEEIHIHEEIKVHHIRLVESMPSPSLEHGTPQNWSAGNSSYPEKEWNTLIHVFIKPMCISQMSFNVALACSTPTKPLFHCPFST